MKNLIIPAIIIWLACIAPFSSALAQTNTFPAFFPGVWTCPDSVELQVPGHFPGSLHQDLIRGKFIPDPFVGTNEDGVQWVSEKAWVFTSYPFDDPKLAKKDMPFTLDIDGVQLYSTWKLNGQTLGSTNNAFHPYSFDLSGLLKESGNVLVVEFKATMEVGAELIAEAGHALPGDAERAVHRMPQFAFGWDWGPRMLDFSVASVNYTSSPPGIIDTNLRTLELDGGTAKCVVEWTLAPGVEESANMRWALTDKEGTKVAWGSDEGEPGKYSMEFEVNDVELWWIHDLGDPYLYKLEVIAYNNLGLVGRDVKQVGIRTLELDTASGNFQFILNGIPIYAQGSNLVPCDIISNRINPREETAIVDFAVEAHMNMIRVWGGGLYASNNLMDYCDQKGVLIWHDFMFACAMYPGNEDFLSSVEKEAEYQTLRLRHHPSLAIWCGNNEVSEGWARWGWKSGLEESEVIAVSESYSKLFNDLLPQIVDTNDDVAYWESSPKLGRGDSNFKNEGDAHDWGIWHDGYPFDSLWTRVPKFMSEYGFQSLPEDYTISTVLSHDSILRDINFRNHPEVIAHEKHSRGFDIIDSYISFTHSNFALDSLTLEQWGYLSRIIQAEGIAEGAIAGRLNSDHCSGTLVWQLNDCWPVASWSSIDGAGRLKILHHKLREAFSPTLLHGTWDGTTLNVSITSNTTRSSTACPGTLLTYLKSLDGTIISSERINLTCTTGQVTSISLPNFLPDGLDPNFHVAHLLWQENDERPDVKHATDLAYLVNPSDLALEKGSIYIKRFGWVDDEYRFEISSDTFAKNVELYSTTPGNFSTNGFDLFPDQPILVSFKNLDTSTFLPDLGESNYSAIPVIQASCLNDLLP